MRSHAIFKLQDHIGDFYMKKRLLAAVLITAFSITACGKSTGEALEEIIVSSAEILDEETGKEPEVEITVEETPHVNAPAVAEETDEEFDPYEFNPHVFSVRDTELWGEDTRDTFYKFCDAIRNGEDTFECPSEEVYYNVVGGRLINYYFPVAKTLINDNYYQNTGYENGVGLIPYGEDKDAFLKEEKEFEEVITDILNDNVRQDYSEFEKALALYIYMTQNYSYDYDMYAEMYGPRGDEIATYRALKEGQGICMELAGVYNYLLLQCGVESDLITGDNPSLGEGHQWNFVRIGGTDYHIDPTFGLSLPYVCRGNTQLDFFMMTDEVRENRDGFPIEDFGICGRGDESRDYFEFAATDDSYSDLRWGYFLEMDTENDIVIYHSYTDDEVKEFHYAA